MRLRPRYGTDPILMLDGDPAAVCEPTVRQRERMVERLADFTEEQWTRPSRCDGWTAQDVIIHLNTVNAFWVASISAGLAGAPTEFLSTFDPVESPAQSVAATTQTSAETFNAFRAGTTSLITLLSNLEPPQWSMLAESPPGHVTISDLAHHALWDSWIHERDIMLPQGEPAVEEHDEVHACLRYVMVLTSALAIVDGVEPIVFDVTVTEPDDAFHVHVGTESSVRSGGAGAGAPSVMGSAVDLLEWASRRSDVDLPLPSELEPIFAGLRTTFDQ